MFFLLGSLSYKTLELTIFNWIQLSQYLSEVCLLRIKHKPDPNPDFKLREGLAAVSIEPLVDPLAAKV